MSTQILVVDDDRSSVDVITEVLKREGHQLFVADGGQAAIQILERKRIDLVITDLQMPDMDGMSLLKHISNQHTHTQVIILTGFGTIDSAVEAMSAGAFNYLQKPIDLNVLRSTTAGALERRALLLQNVNLRQQLDEKFGFANMIGQSKPMTNLFQLIRRVAPTDATVLITGDNGVGKEYIAKAIHNHSRRKDKQFKPINCGAITPTLLESELFGHERGAFTGATARKIGIFEQSDGGTLFLDEIGEMAPEAQVRLLRVLEEGEFTRVGGSQSIKGDVRVLAATNKDLENAVNNREFRADLFHRINVFRLRVPPLRERVEDIPLLANHFVQEISRRYGKIITNINLEAMEYLIQQEWHGNVRDLRNMIETAVILSTSETITLADLSTDFFQSTTSIPTQTTSGHSSLDSERFGHVGMTMEELEKEAIIRALKETDGNRAKAADMLGIGVRTLYRKLESYQIET
ncbi:MAG: sigma-54 dependent transcriptional regulator [Candidatus Poribacteria bacterium]|nr:sigma-54 dependent transcriptional regulator [Candidatus Poribacteria bacterium]